LALDFHIDGLPIAKSSRTQFWTILGKVKNLKDHAPSIVGVFRGDRKPDDANEFLRRFVDELREVIASGISLGVENIPVRLNALICDAPAKAFILSIRSHTGYYSCTKCTVKGIYIEGRVCFPDISRSPRTNATFRGQLQEQHHIGETILKELPMDMIKDVPLDYMHLICLGVVHKLLTLWIRGPKGIKQG
ncbi:unnamed protein product, partial [Ixodes hexagonus]